MKLENRTSLLDGFVSESWTPSEQVAAWLDFVRPKIQTFWDRYSYDRVLFTESDFEHIAWCLHELKARDISKNRGFQEWGCGFAVIAGIAGLLGWPASGFEAESFLLEPATQWHRQFGLSTKLYCSSFLPAGASHWATGEDPQISIRYGERPESDLVDLAQVGLIYVYAWPGEEHFLKQVFLNFAAEDCYLLLYRGPQQVELYRKTV